MSMYSQVLINLFIENKVIPGRSIVELKKGKEVFTGLLLPRPYFGDPNSLVIKLDSGYNIGVKYSESVTLKKIKDVKPKQIKSKAKQNKKLPKISIIGTGGTIMSKLDYTTGGVSPLLTEEEVLSAVPELSSLANIKIVKLFDVFSENFEAELYPKLAKAISKEIKNGAEGVVVMHGTDTMHYTSAMLTFMFENPKVPIVITGSQRSTDRGSSDSYMNLIWGVKAATSNIAEVMICMHGTESDDICYLLPGTNTRKFHTSRRDAFRNIREPIAQIDKDLKVKGISSYRMKGGKLKVDTKIEPNVELIKVYPGVSLDIPKKAEGLVIEGTGLGHVPYYFYEKLKKFGGVKFMTSQCIFGRVNMDVYSSGRELQKVGVIGNLLDMTPETALMKLMWVMGQTKEPKKIKELMETNLRGELSKRTDENWYWEQTK